MAKGGDRKNRWRPRNGEPLLRPAQRGKLELFFVSRLHLIPKTFRYPLVPIGIGVLLRYTGHSGLLLRSFAVLLLAVWLAVDLWMYLLPRKWQWRFVIGWTTNSILLVFVLLCMHWWLSDQMSDQREDVPQKLTAIHAAPEGHDNDPMFEMFSVSNGSNVDISANHGILCNVTHAVGNHGTSQDFNLWMASHGNTVYLGQSRIPASSTLDAGGGTQTEACLRVLGNSFVQGGADCVDVIVVFWYSLENQPEAPQEKKFRFVGYIGRTGKTSWAAEPVNATEDYCGTYFKPLS